MNLKPLFWCVLLLLATACSSGPSQPEIQAVYLTDGPGVLPASQLQAHPEVQVVGSYTELQAAAQKKVGLWIDKNALDLLDGDCQWIQAAPQAYYPIVLVGYNDPLYAFRDMWPCFWVEGPYVDWTTVTLEPGFSVLMNLVNQENSHQQIFQGYQETPTVERLLEVTNELLPQSLAK